jgi:hypothetical protein
MRSIKLGVGLLAIVTSPAALAGTRDFTTQFLHCSEFAGEGTVDLAQAQKLVPSTYRITDAESGTAPVVIRMTHCGGIQVGGTPSMPTTISQIGINIVSPDGTGTINNYVVVYVSDNPYLVKALQHAGAPARYDPTITYQYTKTGDGSAGVLYGAVPGSGLPAYFLYGPETAAPPHSGQLFVANWWFGASAVVKEATTLPAIRFGTSAVAFYTDKTSKLGKLIGGNAYSAFTTLSLRGEYDSGAMIVTVSTAP